MTPFLEGIILGITLAVLLGPALFALVQTSIHRGFRAGMRLAFGIFLSDLTLVFLSFIGALQIVSTGNNRLIFGIIAGFILIVYGIFTFYKTTKLNGNGHPENTNKVSWFTLIAKGYFLNIANPFVWLFWMSVTVGVTSSYGDNTQQSVSFFAGALLTVFTTDLVKAYIAKRIKTLLNTTNIKHINRVVGILLFGFGVVMMVRALMIKYPLFGYSW
ncbi:MAG: LysE family translocator [Bacteroidales bacterium]|jgi:threonine/homoserine/homoserine lactone efflux protein|nr:LysE family translocator [Bacteroidales bacterium]MDD3130506.1 LysE family translocator [Bacteroidales bacterium]MDY0333665.1 LysE family translocator [Bacteroidales bacterium]NCU35538.1 LysE family translocator [Candidatus Falkowbacteria bacterium]NLO52703.1 LysE family translocator [Bacteroidales bacterium]